MQEIEEKLHSALVSKAEINDLCEKLQVKDLEREKEINRIKSLVVELIGANKDLISLLKRYKKEYESLRTRYKKQEAELQEAHSSLAYSENAISEAISQSKQFLLEFRGSQDDRRFSSP
jgi:hypothetical protein